MSVFNDLSTDTRVYREATTLRENGYDVVVVGIRESGSARAPSWAGVKTARIAICLGRKPFPKARYLEHLLKLTGALLRLDGDVYHAHDLDTLLASYIASRSKRAKLVYDAHELMVEESTVQGRPITRAMWWILENLLIRRADRVLTVNRSIANELVKRYGIESPEVVMNCPEYRRTRRTKKLRQILGTESSQSIILYQGGLLPGSGLEVLIESMHWLEQVILVFLGTGPARPELRRLATSRGLEDRVKFLDPVPFDVLPYYTASADLGLAVVRNAGLSYYLSLPNKIFDYIMAGVPVVASDFPERGRAVLESGTGVAVDPSDPRAIAEVVKSLLRDRRLYRRMVANCRKTAKMCNWGTESSKLVALYESLFRDPG